MLVVAGFTQSAGAAETRIRTLPVRARTFREQVKATCIYWGLNVHSSRIVISARGIEQCPYACYYFQSAAANKIRASYRHLEAYLERLQICVRGLLVLSQGFHHECHVAQSAAVDAVSSAEVVVYLINEPMGHLQSILRHGETHREPYYDNNRWSRRG